MNLLAGLAVVAGAAEVNLREFAKVTKGNQLESKCLASAQAYSDVERCVNYRTQLRGRHFMHTSKCPTVFLLYCNILAQTIAHTSKQANV
jgi:hypothetical protein